MKFLVGSQYFFKDVPGFRSKNKDYVRILEKFNGFQYVRQVTLNGVCYFDVVKRPVDELIEWSIQNAPAMAVGKFLVPEVANELGLSFEDLTKLAPMIEKLDEKYQYEQIIFNSYIENGEMKLTENQLQMAYESYKNSRNQKES